MSTGGDLVGEAQAGTLEQMYMTPAPTEILVLGRVFATLITTTVMVFLTGIALILILGLNIPVRWQAFPVMGLTLAGLFGFALMLGGATLIFKQIRSTVRSDPECAPFPSRLAASGKPFPSLAGNICPHPPNHARY